MKENGRIHLGSSPDSSPSRGSFSDAPFPFILCVSLGATTKEPRLWAEFLPFYRRGGQERGLKKSAQVKAGKTASMSLQAPVRPFSGAARGRERS